MNSIIQKRLSFILVILIATLFVFFVLSIKKIHEHNSPDNRFRDKQRLVLLKEAVKAIKPLPALTEDMQKQAVNGLCKQDKKVNILMKKNNIWQEMKLPYYFDFQAWAVLLEDNTELRGNKCELTEQAVTVLSRNVIKKLAWKDGKAFVYETILDEPNPWAVTDCVFVSNPFVSKGGSPVLLLSGSKDICGGKLIKTVSEAGYKDFKVQQMDEMLYKLNAYSNSILLESKEKSSFNRKKAALSVRLTLNPTMQETAQKLTDCYAGIRGDCGDAIEKDKDHYKDREQVKLAGLVVLDVKTGGILAAASSKSGSLLKIDNKAENIALFRDFNPASTIKVILAAAALKNNFTNKTYSDLQPSLLPKMKNYTGDRHSSSLALGNALAVSSNIYFAKMANDFHGNGGFNAIAFKNTARAFGMDTGSNNCGKNKNQSCTSVDILSGQRITDLSANYPHLLSMMGQVFVKGEGRGKGYKVREVANDNIIPMVDAKTLAIIELRLKKEAGDDYQNAVNRVVKSFPSNEQNKIRRTIENINFTAQSAIGQADTRATALGMAHIMAHIGATAAGSKKISLPHLIQSIHNTAGTPVKVETTSLPAELSKNNAAILIMMLSKVIVSGTASASYKKVFGKNPHGLLSIAGKTGTSDADIKWFIGLYKSKHSIAYHDRAFAVVIEQGIKKNGNIDNANKSAELAFEFIKYRGKEDEMR